MNILAIILFIPLTVFLAIVKYLILGFIGAFFAVPLSLVADGVKRTPRIWWLWGNDEIGFTNADMGFDRWALYVDRAWRNPVGNSKYLLASIFGDPREFEQHGNVARVTDGPDPMEQAGFKWRYRRAGLLMSIRITVGKERPKKGKHEFYAGFKIGSKVEGFGFTLQMR